MNRKNRIIVAILAVSTFTLTGIRPGEYDIRFVDEDGNSCTLANHAHDRNRC